MKSCYPTPKDTPEKLKIVRDNLTKVSFIDKSIILDIGGISSYYDVLKVTFSQGELYLLNINPNEVKEVNNAIVGDATRLPFRNESIDVITSFDLVEHLINPDDFLEESFRILKWGVVCDFNAQLSRLL